MSNYLRRLRLRLETYANLEICIQIGATRGSQLEGTLRAFEDGPLDESIVKRVDKVFNLVKAEAPVDKLHV